MTLGWFRQVGMWPLWAGTKFMQVDPRKFTAESNSLSTAGIFKRESGWKWIGGSEAWWSTMLIRKRSEKNRPQEAL